MVPMRDSDIVEALHEPELGAPASLPACCEADPETRRQGCRRSQYPDQFMVPTRDSDIVEAAMNLQSPSVGTRSIRVPNFWPES